MDMWPSYDPADAPANAIRQTVDVTCSSHTHSASTDTMTSPEVDVTESVGYERDWIVIVWNDPVNLMSYVTYVLQKLFGYSTEKATELMLAVHHEGRANVANGNREQCEMHVFRLHEHGLWATLEEGN
jgi:ATP-dependent Clp protease adaptor protein ClpS